MTYPNPQVTRATGKHYAFEIMALLFSSLKNVLAVDISTAPRFLDSAEINCTLPTAHFLFINLNLSLSLALTRIIYYICRAPVVW